MVARNQESMISFLTNNVCEKTSFIFWATVHQMNRYLPSYGRHSMHLMVSCSSQKFVSLYVKCDDFFWFSIVRNTTLILLTRMKNTFSTSSITYWDVLFNTVQLDCYLYIFPLVQSHVWFLKMLKHFWLVSISDFPSYIFNYRQESLLSALPSTQGCFSRLSSRLRALSLECLISSVYYCHVHPDYVQICFSIYWLCGLIFPLKWSQWHLQSTEFPLPVAFGKDQAWCFYPIISSSSPFLSPFLFFRMVSCSSFTDTWVGNSYWWECFFKTI